MPTQADLSGKIIERIYLGSIIQYAVELGDGSVMQVTEQNPKVIRSPGEELVGSAVFPSRRDTFSAMKGAREKYLGVFLPMAAVIAAPIILRDDDAAAMNQAELRLEVITPHNELIRREFGEAFSRWYEKKHGESVYVNWQTPGGTSEIKRVLDSRFKAAEKEWE